MRSVREEVVRATKSLEKYPMKIGGPGSATRIVITYWIV